MADRPHIFDLTREQLRAIVQQHGMPAFRADQVLDWVYRKHIADPARMANLSKAHRAKLSQVIRFTTGDVVSEQRATDGVRKLLVQWHDSGSGPLPLRGRVRGGDDSHDDDDVHAQPGAAPPFPGPSLERGGSERSLSTIQADPTRQTECVMIPVDGADGQRARRTACVSSQVGCAVGCTFCASGLGGLDADLSAGRIVEQVWRLGAMLHADGDAVGRITNVVFMGMGEPLANFEQVVRAVRIMTAEWGLAISARRITISTVGLPAQMRRLAELELPVTLAISLHAPNDALRRRLIPWAEYVTIEQLLEAGRHYFERTGREITLEYILLGGVNDQPEHASQLAGVAKTLRANVNLIRYNEVKGLPYNRPHTEDVRAFQQTLRGAGVSVHIRASRGRDIAAACGQLRHESRRV